MEVSYIPNRTTSHPDFVLTGNTSTQFEPRPVRSLNSQRLLSVRRPQSGKTVTAREFARLLEVAEQFKHTGDLRDLAVLIFYTGIRPNEMLFLRWQDINFGERQMMVRRSKRGRKRIVPIGPKVMQVLQARRKMHPPSESILGRFSRATLAQAARKLSALHWDVRTEPITLQLLRESFMRRWITAGGDPEQLALITGTPSRIRSRSSRDMNESSLAEAARFLEEFEQSDE